jgi:hypothetical protein
MYSYVGSDLTSLAFKSLINVHFVLAKERPLSVRNAGKQLLGSISKCKLQNSQIAPQYYCLIKRVLANNTCDF